MLAPFTVNSALDNGDGANTTFREAIEQANVNPGADTIQFASNVNGATINLNPNFGSLVVTDPVSILGPSNKVTIQPQFNPTIPTYGLDYVYSTGAGVPMVVSNMIISGFTSGIRVTLLPAGSQLMIETSESYGSTAIDNVGGAGIEITSGASVSINLSDFAGNDYGIYVHDTSSSNLVSIEGNNIGVNSFAGVLFDNADRPFEIAGNDIVQTQSGPGIAIHDSSSTVDSRIQSGNIISDNLTSGIELVDAAFPNLIIQQNVIGTDFSAADRGNGTSGIIAENSVLSMIQLNTIGFNGGSGIVLDETHGVSVVSNNIGTDTNVIGNSTDLGNGGVGIGLSGSADTIVTYNAIAFNLGSGIAVVDDPGVTGQASRNVMFSNSFWANGGSPIDLGNDGPTANHFGRRGQRPQWSPQCAPIRPGRIGPCQRRVASTHSH